MSRSVFLSSTTQLTCHLELYFSIRFKRLSTILILTSWCPCPCKRFQKSYWISTECSFKVTLWWQRYDGDHMAVTDSRFRWQNPYVGDICDTLLYLKIRIYNRRRISQCICLTKISRKIEKYRYEKGWSSWLNQDCN